MHLLLLILFIALPLAELFVIIEVAQWIGLVPTLVILLLDGFVGAALGRTQGRAAWMRFNRALSEGRVPAHETFDGAMIILGGALLLAPGFITDAVGFFLLIPPTRTLLRRGVARLARRRVSFGWTIATPPPPVGGRPRAQGPFRSRDGYDYEGTAREVNEPSGELPRPEGDER